MFREITRKNRAISTDESISILKTEPRGVLSVIGDEGYPYGMPMNHYYNEEDGAIYFHQGKQGHRLDAIRQNAKASYCVIDKGEEVPNSWVKIFKSVIVFGKIEVIDDLDTIIDISTKLSHKFTSDDEFIKEEIEKYAKATLLLKLSIEHISGKRVKEQ